MRDIVHLIPLFALFIHESGRASVAAGDTLAHAVGQPRPAFTEWPDIRPDARCGRELTAERLLENHDFRPRTHPPEELHESEVMYLANEIHKAEREAIERGLTVVKLDPPRPWIPFDDLPEQAKQGRQRQARWFLARFDMYPLPRE
jgi:hypothetical protein